MLPPLVLAVANTAVANAAVAPGFRLLTNIKGLYSLQVVEILIKIYCFSFLFLQRFLTVSLSSKLANIVGKLTATVQSVPALLARNLPKACNYFFSFIFI
jgi:hypothetical protein